MRLRVSKMVCLGPAIKAMHVSANGEWRKLTARRSPVDRSGSLDVCANPTIPYASSSVAYRDGAIGLILDKPLRGARRARVAR